jgi:putative restriction endonuclease
MAKANKTGPRVKHWHVLVGNLGTWKQGSQRAVHKPLLTLMLLARAQRGGSNRVPYAEIAAPLKEALVEFGPSRKSVHPEYPFWYLQNDGFWELPVADELERRKGKDQPTHSALLEHQATGVVPAGLWAELSGHRHEIKTLAEIILDQFWPESFHADIADSLGLDLSGEFEQIDRRKRDPAFREEVLRAYERRCAVCGYDGRIGNSLVGLEAAHIHFKQFNGPDLVENGLALCALHHKVFDRGGMGLTPDRRLLVSQDLGGHETVREMVLKYQGRALVGPQAGAPAPAAKFIAWHQKEVFRGPARG